MPGNLERADTEREGFPMDSDNLRAVPQISDQILHRIPPTRRQVRRYADAAPAAQVARKGGRKARVVLWGAPASGKTVFLASLPLVASADPGSPWRAIFNDANSVNRLSRLSDLIGTEGLFPPGTMLGESTSIYITLHNDEAVSRTAGPLHRKNYADLDIRIVDVAGELFAASNLHDDRNPIIAELTDANLLIYLLDPVLQGLGGDSLHYFASALRVLSAAMHDKKTLRGGFLPQYLAVCVTKFDDPRIFLPAERGGWVSRDAWGRPRVASDRAAAFFDWVCNYHLTGGDARYVQEAIRASFSQDRIRYYATSALGFFQPAVQALDTGDYSNVAYGQDGFPRGIRGPIQPVNVLEPFIDFWHSSGGRP